jgi:hypothetical protein
VRHRDELRHARFLPEEDARDDAEHRAGCGDRDQAIAAPRCRRVLQSGDVRSQPIPPAGRRSHRRQRDQAPAHRLERALRVGALGAGLNV